MRRKIARPSRLLRLKPSRSSANYLRATCNSRDWKLPARASKKLSLRSRRTTATTEIGRVKREGTTMIAAQRDGAVEISTKLEASGASTPWWVSASVIVGAMLMGAGAVIALVRPAMLVAPNAEITAAVRVYAGYLVSRNLALAAMLVAMLAMRARGVLSSLMVLTAFIQLL